MGMRFAVTEIDANPIDCAHDLLDHFLERAQQDGFKSHALIYPRARALLHFQTSEVSTTVTVRRSILPRGSDLGRTRTLVRRTR